MFCLNDTMRYHLYPGRTDMRKGINSLIGVVKEKLLHAEDGGMVRYVKRLEAGRFKLPEYDQDTKSYPMEWRDLVVMVEGINEDPASRLRRLRAERSEYPI